MVTWFIAPQYNRRDWSLNLNTIAIRRTMLFSFNCAWTPGASEDHIKHFNPTDKILHLSFYFPRRTVRQQIIFRAKKSLSQSEQSRISSKHLCGEKRATSREKNLTWSFYFKKSERTLCETLILVASGTPGWMRVMTSSFGLNFSLCRLFFSILTKDGSVFSGWKLFQVPQNKLRHPRGRCIESLGSFKRAITE